MTGRDPAIEAAQRAWHGNSDNDGGDPQIDVHDRRVWDTSEAAAREALAPIREKHHVAEVGGRQICNEDGYDWPCETARLIYREDEL